MAEGTPNVMQFYRYNVDSFDIIFPNDPNPVNMDPKQITVISLERDFDNDYFPILRVNMTMDPNLYFKILSNKLGVKIRMRMQKSIFDAKKAFRFKRDVFNDVFSVFIDDNTPNIDKNQQKTSKETEKSQKTPRDLNNEVSFYLFKESDLLNSKKIINAVLSSASLVDAVTYCLSTSGFNRVLMSPFDNRGSVKELVLPPLTVLGELLYLEQQYGFYNKGSLIFFDVDASYIIDRNPTCTAYRRDEFRQTIFTIKDPTNAHSFNPGSLINEKEKRFFINVTPGSINMYNDSIINDQIDGNNLITINPYSGTVKTINSNAIQRGGGSYKILVNRYNNNFINEAEAHRRRENGNVVHVSLNDFDIESLSPNKEFIFLFQDTEINKSHSGNYRISKSVVTFGKSGEEFIITGFAEFKK